MSANIQQARDVLAKWRDRSTDGPWKYDSDAQEVWVESPANADIIIADEGLTVSDARLIVGTAGNPDLLDAIDGVLAKAQEELGWYTYEWVAISKGVGAGALLIADAIIAADEQMNA